MITDDDLINLPDDPELAFVQYESSIRKRVQSAITNSAGYGTQEHQFEYISHVLGMVKALNLDVLSGWRMPSADESEEIIQGTYIGLLADVDELSPNLVFEHLKRSGVSG